MQEIFFFNFEFCHLSPCVIYEVKPKATKYHIPVSNEKLKYFPPRCVRQKRMCFVDTKLQVSKINKGTPG